MGGTIGGCCSERDHDDHIHANTYQGSSTNFEGQKTKTIKKKRDLARGETGFL